MNVQILERGGIPEYAVIPYADYEAMRDAAEMLDDIAAYDKARAEMKSCEDEAIPFDMNIRLSDGANPVAEWRKYRGLTQAALAGFWQTAWTVSDKSSTKKANNRNGYWLL